MAAAKSNVNVKIDSVVKEQATQLMAQMGLDQTTAIELLYRQIIVDRKLPFQPSLAPDYAGYANQISEIVKQKNIPHKAVSLNAEGHIVIDKDKDPEEYDWAVNG
jgi:DNA-damage-inducible protein J